MLRRASRPERLDDDQASAAAGTREGEDARPVDRIGAVGVGRGCASGEQLADAGDVGGAIAVSQESVVADAVSLVVLRQCFDFTWKTETASSVSQLATQH